jgi:Tol biopolymer transport system component
MRNIYKKSLYVVFSLIILVGLFFVFYPAINSLPDPKISPAERTTLAIKSTVLLTFPAEMDRNSIEKRLSFEPDQAVDIIWNGLTAQLIPRVGFKFGSQITIHLMSGASSRDGRKYSKDLTWTYKIRQASIVYLGNATTSPEIWIYDPVTNKKEPLTDTGGHITDFAACPDGDEILYIQKNNSGGSDLYSYSRETRANEMVVNCGQESCIDPAISADGQLFAFSRNRNPENGKAENYSYIYTGELKKGDKSISPLITEKNIPGILPSFSPDMNKIAFYDPISKGIRIENNAGNNDFLLGTNRIQRGSWSADGNYLIIVDDESGPEGLHSRLFAVDLVNSTLKEPIKELITDSELGEPDWSPDGFSIVAGIRAEGGPVARQLALFNVKSNSVTMITKDQTVMSASPKWSPDGSYIVFQQARLGESNTKPEISVWDVQTGSINTIAEDAALPEWLP